MEADSQGDPRLHLQVKNTFLDFQTDEDRSDSCVKRVGVESMEESRVAQPTGLSKSAL